MAKNDARLIVFNWKENPQTLREASRLFLAIVKTIENKGRKDVEVVACPPVIYLKELSGKLAVSHAHFSFGAQDVFWEEQGAYTGGIGPLMLRGIGKNIRYVIVGHSERRRWFGETDEMVNKKVHAALIAGLRVILCIGEPAEVRKQGFRASQRYIKDQLKKDLQGLKNFKFKIKNLVVAYEPIWAIGTGNNCPATDALAMIQFIKKETFRIFGFRQLSVLYGGSVDSRTIADYLCYHEVSGVLVGSASLRAEEVKKILKAIS
jgi:triosephosphate isomerase